MASPLDLLLPQVRLSSKFQYHGSAERVLRFFCFSSNFSFRGPPRSSGPSFDRTTLGFPLLGQFHTLSILKGTQLPLERA